MQRINARVAIVACGRCVVVVHSAGAKSDPRPTRQTVGQQLRRACKGSRQFMSAYEEAPSAGVPVAGGVMASAGGVPAGGVPAGGAPAPPAGGVPPLDGAAGTGCDVHVKLAVEPPLPLLDSLHKTTCLACTSMNHADALELPLVPPDDVPIRGMKGIELSDGAGGGVVGGVCANAIDAGRASAATRRWVRFICCSWIKVGFAWSGVTYQYAEQKRNRKVAAERPAH